MGRSLTRLKSTLTMWAPKEVDRDLCVIWLNVLKDFTDQQIRDAFLKAASDLTEWPAPATVKRLILGSNKTDEEIGQEVASRIEGAIVKIGFFYDSDYERIKLREKSLVAEIGEIGFEVVRQCGGWNHICTIETEQLISMRKQWRDIATIVAKNFFTSGTNLPTGLPSNEKKNTVLSAAIKLALGTEGIAVNG